MKKKNGVSPNIKIMQDAAERLKLTWPSSFYRVSRKGVPHVIADTGYRTFSVCWFGKSQIFRVFYPYPNYGSDTVRADFETLEGVETYLDQQTKLAYNNSKLNRVSNARLSRETHITYLQDWR